MSEPLKPIQVRLPKSFYERLEDMAVAQQRTLGGHARILLEKTICGEWHVFEQKARRVVEAVREMERRANTRGQQKEPVHGFVYVIRLGDFYKIGRSVRPTERINGMSLSEKPEVICTIKVKDAAAFERGMHKKYRKHKHHREWFKLPPDVVDELRKRAS